MGASASKAAEDQRSPTHASVGGHGRGDAFDAVDVLRHLQEIEGYEVYDVFERAKGARVPAQVRVWLEALEDPSSSGAGASRAATASASGAPSAAAPKAPAASSAAQADDGADDDQAVDLERWVVLSSPPSQLRPVRAKGRGPPPPKAKGPPGKAPPAVAKAKAGFTPAAKKAAAPAPPPPFGKRLHWKLLPPANLGDTIFEELRPWGEAPPINTCQLERLFARPVAPPPRATSTAAVPGSASDAAGGGVAARRHTFGGPASAAGRNGGGQVQLLDAKRAQNLAIVLRQVPIPTEELSEVLRWMRLSHPVSVDALEHIQDNILPPLLEAAELLRYDGPPEALRDVERQLLPLARLPRLKARMQIMLFSKKVPILHAKLLSRIRALRDGCSEVRGSGALRQVFGTVLRVGNYLNHGVDAPDAGGGVEVRGFAVESLLKLRDFRAAQGGEVSALHCVVLHLLPSSPQLLTQLRGELRAVLEPGEGGIGGHAGGCIAELRDEVARFRSETDLVQGEIERFADCYRSDGGAAEGPGALSALQRLVEDASELATGLQEALAEAQSDAQRLLEYFGEQRRSVSCGVSVAPGGAAAATWDDEASANVERFFATIREFVMSFEDCWREVLEQPRRLRLETAAPAPAPARPVQLGPGASAVVAAPQAASQEAAQAAAAQIAAQAAAIASGAGGELQRAKPHSPTTLARKSSACLAMEAQAAVRRRSTRGARAGEDGGKLGMETSQMDIAAVD